ncbi:hypothetical protein K469DRAFT_62197 [Zopfia rhizophila CBS 207.26]|uniref:Uncharacterized protein n=1 Tax=Zopfia rhizophila CBS 207.26 TaxID=1314779 RepID=A0A6A6EDZ0_9PEZI|nr:hypothetical protein K469DRAFT_62197 [Zopfia rhizophila CBS 207.26]
MIGLYAARCARLAVAVAVAVRTFRRFGTRKEAEAGFRSQFVQLEESYGENSISRIDNRAIAIAIIRIFVKILKANVAVLTLFVRGHLNRRPLRKPPTSLASSSSSACVKLLTRVGGLCLTNISRPRSREEFQKH